MRKKIIKQLVLPLLIASVLAVLFKSIYMQDGVCNYFLAWILIGFPFGIRKMFLWLVPSRFDFAGTIGVLMLNVIVGGIIGGFVLIIGLISGIFNLFKLVIDGITNR